MTVKLRGLSPKSFRVYEDGKEQTIQNVTFERVPHWQVQDNMSVHTESSCTPRGYWKGPDIPQSQFPFFTARFTQQSDVHIYLVSYAPPPSLEGACHHLKVKVNHRPALMVYFRDAYCSTENSVSDPLKGTKLGSQVSDYLDSTRIGKLSLLARTSQLFGAADKNLVQVAVEFPWDLLNEYGWEIVSTQRSEYSG